MSGKMRNQYQSYLVSSQYVLTMFSYSHTTLHLLTHNPTPTYTQPYTYSHTTLHLLTQPTHTQKPTPYFSIFTLILLPYIHHYHSIHPPAHIYHHYYPRNILFPYYLLIFFQIFLNFSRIFQKSGILQVSLRNRHTEVMQSRTGLDFVFSKQFCSSFAFRHRIHLSSWHS